MLGNFGTHIHHNPAGTYSFVGTIPLVLAETVKPTTADIMAGRYFTDPNGKAHGYKFPTFDTEAKGREFAASKGVELKN